MKVRSVAFTLFALLWTIRSEAQTFQTASSFALDYDVPESPAFVVLGGTPTIVYGTGTTKPLMLNLLSKLLTGDKVGSGLALDFAPFQSLINLQIHSIDAYRSSWISKLARLQLSAGTLTPAADTNTLRIAAGFRVVLYDDHDPIEDDAFVESVGFALAAATTAPTYSEAMKILHRKDSPRGDIKDSLKSDTIATNIVAVPSLAPLYAKARMRMAEKSGIGLAIGAATSNNYSYITNSTAFGGSAAWLSFSWYRPIAGAPLDLLSTVKYNHAVDSNFATIGVAVRGTSDLMMLNAESNFSTLTHSLGGAMTLELKIITGIRAVLDMHLMRDPDSDRYRLRSTTSFKYDLAN